MMFDPFILELFRDPRYFFAVVITVVVSICLHELAHGWMAMRHGDDTPLRTGHMTANPMVHMGPMSIIALLIVGLAWGAMPIDPTRMRGRYAEALVAFAGPLTNLLLAIAALVGLGLWLRFAGPPEAELSQAVMNGRLLLTVFSLINFVLFAFNLFPIPPLDGSHILANFHRPYARFISDPAKQGPLLLMFIIPFMMAPYLMEGAMRVMITVGELLAGRPIYGNELGV